MFIDTWTTDRMWRSQLNAGPEFVMSYICSGWFLRQSINFWTSKFPLHILCMAVNNGNLKYRKNIGKYFGGELFVYSQSKIAIYSCIKSLQINGWHSYINSHKKQDHNYSKSRNYQPVYYWKDMNLKFNIFLVVTLTLQKRLGQGHDIM